MSENQYTPEERKQIASALRGAKKRLRSGAETNKTPFICWALPCSKAGYNTRREIMRRLGGAATVKGWLQNNYHIYSGQYISREEIQAYRHRWVDALIEEFSQ